jgi:hypothetical protein
MADVPEGPAVMSLLATAGTAALASGSVRGASFWQEAALNAVSPVVAAILGGIVVGMLIQLAQDRRNLLQLRNTLSVDMVRTSYKFYHPLIEVIRREQYAAASAPPVASRATGADVLADEYEEFRLSARVIEEQLRINFPNAGVRWLWHGVVDMLSSRYYRQVHIPARFNDMIKVHSEHVDDPEIPPQIRAMFMTAAEYRSDTVDAELFKRFETFLNDAVREVLKLTNDPLSGAAVLRPGRGPLGWSWSTRTDAVPPPPELLEVPQQRVSEDEPDAVMPPSGAVPDALPKAMTDDGAVDS